MTVHSCARGSCAQPVEPDFAFCTYMCFILSQLRIKLLKKLERAELGDAPTAPWRVEKYLGDMDVLDRVEEALERELAR